MLTYSDLLDHALAYGGDDASQTATTRHRRAVQAAYTVLPTRHHWSYYWGLGRVTTVAAYATGTVQYVQSTNQLTLTGGIWPSWAAEGYLIINNRPYQIDTRVSDTVLTLDASTAPPADIAAGTTYSLQQDQYPLPADFVSSDECVINEVGAVLEYMHPRNWASERRTNVGPGQPWMFTIIGDKDVPGTCKQCLWPPPDGTYAVDFLYLRKPRPMVYESVTQGTVSVSGTTVTGTGTNFRTSMVGSFLRLAADASAPPTGAMGGNPALYEVKITAVASTTSLTVAVAPTDTFTGVAYQISDPVDIDPTVMQELLLREIEAQMRPICRMEPLDTEPREYAMALTRALEADNRSTARAGALRKQTRRSGFIHYPIQFTGG